MPVQEDRGGEEKPADPAPLPLADEAFVPPAKLTAYLLSLSHPVGRAKAKLLRAVGFNEGNIDALSMGLRAIARDNVVAATERTEHGTKYVIVGTLATPSGGTLQLRTVWLIEEEGQRPRLVTAYPRRVER